LRLIKFFFVLLVLSGCAAASTYTGPLTDQQQEDFLKYKKLRRAKAFAIGENNASGWAYGFSSVGIARKKALAGCNYSNGYISKCRIYDLVGP
jgi:hypothetical protein